MQFVDPMLRGAYDVLLSYFCAFVAIAGRKPPVEEDYQHHHSASRGEDDAFEGGSSVGGRLVSA